MGTRQARAVDVDFYSDATLEIGDVYNVVSVYDTPPDHTTIDMFGGSINKLRIYDSSTVNVYGGEILWSIESYNGSTVNVYGGEILWSVISRDSSAVNIYGGIINFESLFVINSSTLNIYGGDLLVGNSPGFSESSTVNIYGYGFEYEARSLTGLLSDGSSFIFRELFSDEYLHMNLIVVPEPISAEIDIQPDTLNISSEGRWISCRIQFPEDYEVGEIDPNSVLLEDEIQAESFRVDEEQQVATARFKRSDVQAILEVGEVELTVTGQFLDGTVFEGTDTIKVINKGRKNKHAVVETKNTKKTLHKTGNYNIIEST